MPSIFVPPRSIPIRIMSPPVRLRAREAPPAPAFLLGMVLSFLGLAVYADVAAVVGGYYLARIAAVGCNGRAMILDANGAPTTFGYDALGRLVKVTEPRPGAAGQVGDGVLSPSLPPPGLLKRPLTRNPSSQAQRGQPQN